MLKLKKIQEDDVKCYYAIDGIEYISDILLYLYGNEHEESVFLVTAHCCDNKITIVNIEDTCREIILRIGTIKGNVIGSTKIVNHVANMFFLEINETMKLKRDDKNGK